MINLAQCSQGLHSLVLQRDVDGTFCAGAADLNVIRPRLLPILEAWILPNGAYGWCSSIALVEHAEPLCSALNLLRLLVLREHCQVRRMEACPKIAQRNAATRI